MNSSILKLLHNVVKHLFSFQKHPLHMKENFKKMTGKVFWDFQNGQKKCPKSIFQKYFVKKRDL